MSTNIDNITTSLQFPSGKELNIVTINRLSREIYLVFFYGKKGKISMKATRHNGRSGKHGTYDAKHNDRRFDVENSEHTYTDKKEA